MHVRFLASLLSLTLATISCDRRSAPPAPLHPRKLSALPLQLDLPDDVSVQEATGRVAIIVHPGRRTPLRIDIQSTPQAIAFDPTGTKTQSLAKNLQLTYHESVQPGGSGGEEAALIGELTLGGERYRITCQQQSELHPSAQACLPILATLRASPTN